MKERIIAWWNAERVGRVEEGTSQDMCPTNGDVVFFALVMITACAPAAVAVIMACR